jgi:dihydroneopterin aldolase
MPGCWPDEPSAAWPGAAHPQRRASISVLADGDKYTEHQLDTLIRYQEAIEAIDRAIKEEQRAAKEQLAAELAASVQPLIKYED